MSNTNTPDFGQQIGSEVGSQLGGDLGGAVGEYFGGSVGETLGHEVGSDVGGFVGGMYLIEVDGSFMQSLYDISLVIVIISLAWLGLIATLPNPLKKKIAYINLDETSSGHLNKLDSLDGCDEWYINNTENIVIVKYDDDLTSEDNIKQLIQ